MTKIKLKMAELISHIYQDNVGHWIIQSNEEHSVGVTRLASRFAGEFGMSEWGKVLGQLHDKGKESHAFQQHIKKESGYEPGIKVCGIITMHLLVEFWHENFMVNLLIFSSLIKLCLIIQAYMIMMR